MGGKRKQAPRTKGNTKPSSSGRTAEKLAASGSSVAGFVGFTGLQVDPSFLPLTQGTDDVDNTVDADFRLAMRKMTKRDVTTRLKALQEFSTLCQERPTEEIRGSLSFWPRLFNKLAMDHDRRVREALFQAHEKLVIRVRKNLAPYLRTIMGSWLLAHSDPYAPAASAAESAFKSAFPPNKQAEAIAFCKTEVVMLLEDNLFKQTAQTLSNSDCTPEEDMEGKYIRIISSSLLTWRLLLNTLPQSEHESLMEAYSKMLSENKFWKLPKHESPMIRSAWFRLVSTLCQVVPSLVNEKASKLCPIVLSCLDEANPAVASVVWEAAMYVLVTDDDCWKHVNARKAVLPKLWTVLQEGGNGNANAIYPNLLPFLNKVSPEVMGDPIQFHTEFFHRMRKGLALPKVQSSPSELDSVLRAFVECLKYLIVKNIDQNEFRLHEVVADQLLPVIQSSLQEKTSKLNTSNLYGLVSDLMQFLHNSAKTEKPYEKLESYLWSQLEEMSREILEIVEEDNLKFSSQRLSNLLLNLIDPGRLIVQKSVRVQFSDEIDEEGNTEEFSQRKQFILTEDHPLQSLLQNICVMSMKKIRDEKSFRHLSFLASVMRFYFSPVLLKHLIEGEIEESNMGIEFFDGIVCPLLKNEDFKAESEFPSIVTDLVLAGCKCVIDDREKMENILNRVCDACSPSILECLLKKISENENEEAFTSWLKSKKLGNTLKQLAWKLCSNTSSGSCFESDVVWRLLSFCLSTDNNFEPLVSVDCLGQILDAFQQNLPKPGSPDSRNFDASLKFICNLASRLFANAKGCWGIPSSEDLLLTMFLITCQPPPNLSEELLEQVKSTWLVGVNALLSVKQSDIREDGFFNRAAKSVQHVLTTESITSRSLEEIYNSASALLTKLYAFTDEESSAKEEQTYSISGIDEFYNVLLPSDEVWTRLRQNFGEEWLMKMALDETLTTTEFDFNQKLGCTNFNHLYYGVFVSRILKQIFNFEKTRGRRLSIIHLKNLVCAKVMSAAMIMNDDSEKKCILLLVEELSGLITDLIELLTEDDIEQLGSELIRLCLSDCCFWPVCLEDLARNGIFEEKFTEIARKVDLFEEFPLNSSEFRTAQVLHKCCPRFSERNHGKSLIEIGDNCDLKTAVQLIVLYREQFKFVNTEGSREDILDFLISWRDARPETLLFAVDVTQQDWLTVCFNIETQKLIATIVREFSVEIQSRHWDFILCGLCSWMQSCYESQNSIWTHLPTLLFVKNCCNLFRCINESVEDLSKESQPRLNHPDLIVEWNEFFSEGIYSVVLPLVINLSEAKISGNLTYAEHCLLISSTVALEKIPLTFLENHRLSVIKSVAVGKAEENIPENLQILLSHLCLLLGSSVRAIQLIAFKLLAKIIPLLAKYNEKEDFTEGSSENFRHLPSTLQTFITETTAIANAYFAEVVVGSNQPGIFLESNSHMMSYLLGWTLILELFGAASSELRSEYAEYLHSSGLMHDLLANLFYLIPENATLPKTSSDSSTKYKTMFSEKPLLSAENSNSTAELQHQACQVYFQAVKKLPAFVRQWWNNQDKHMLSSVERITAKYVSVLLSNEELQSVQSSGKNFENMSVRARLSACEVVAVYTIDEVSMEIIIKLAPNHPLGPVTVECGRRIGVGNTQWRNWMLQLNTFLMYQNGSILDGLTLWKRNIDKKFEGIEECCICYYVLHGSNCQLPKLLCRTCKKKFHSACLYKWFSTSNQSTCPLCRNLF